MWCGVAWWCGMVAWQHGGKVVCLEGAVWCGVIESQ